MESLYQSTLSIIPELILLVTGLVILIFGLFCKSDYENKGSFIISVIGVTVSFILNIQRFNNPESAFSGSLLIDDYSVFFNTLFLVVLFISLFFTYDFIKTLELKSSDLYSLLLFATTGMMFLCSSSDLMSLFLSFEIMSVAVYVLTGINRKSTRSTEAGIKYLVLGGFSSAILLMGIALIYGTTGSIVFVEIAKIMDFNNYLTILGISLILIGFIFKIGAFPLHQWVPDIYEGAPVSVTGFMSVGIKAAAFSVLLRVFFDAFSGFESQWLLSLWFISVLTVTIGNISAIVQDNLKRMLAYSSIAHAGYALIGITSAIGNSQYAISSVSYYLFAYTFMNLGAFGILTYLSKTNNECENYEQISGLWYKKPLLALCLSIFMLSLAGIPPFLGFFAKYRVFLSTINAELYWLAVIGIVNSVISAYYYIKVLVYCYMKEEKADFPSLKLSSSVVIIIISLVNVLFGLFPFSSWDFAVKAASSLSF